MAQRAKKTTRERMSASMFRILIAHPKKPKGEGWHYCDVHEGWTQAHRALVIPPKDHGMQLLPSYFICRDCIRERTRGLVGLAGVHMARGRISPMHRLALAGSLMDGLGKRRGCTESGETRSRNGTLKPDPEGRPRSPVCSELTASVVPGPFNGREG